MKNWTTAFITLAVFLVSAMPINGYADSLLKAVESQTISGNDVSHTGNIGTCVWRVDEQGCLIISPSEGGVGSIDNLPYEPMPWDSISSDITSIRITGSIRCKDPSVLCRNCDYLQEIDLTGLDITESTSIDWLAHNKPALKTVTWQNANFSSITSAIGAFSDCPLLSSIAISTSEAPSSLNCRFLFSGCKSLKQIDLTWLNGCSVTDASNMFSFCENLQEINLAPVAFSECKSFSGMFSSCSKLSTVSGTIDATKCQSMQGMFTWCDLLDNLPVITNTNKVQDFSEMFYGCRSIKTFDLSHIDTSSAIKMEKMFWVTYPETIIMGTSFSTRGLYGQDSLCDLPRCSSSSSTGRWVADNDRHTAYANVMLPDCVSTTYYGQDTQNIIDTTNVCESYSWKIDSLGCLCVSITDSRQDGIIEGHSWADDTQWDNCEKSITSIELSPDIKASSNLEKLFEGCTNLLSANLSQLECPEGTSTIDCFAECEKLREIKVSPSFPFQANSFFDSGTLPYDSIGGWLDESNNYYTCDSEIPLGAKTLTRFFPFYTGDFDVVVNQCPGKEISLTYKPCEKALEFNEPFVPVYRWKASDGTILKDWSTDSTLLVEEKFLGKQPVCEVIAKNDPLQSELTVFDIPKLEHSLGSWTVIRNPNYRFEGVSSASCTSCNFTQTKPIMFEPINITFTDVSDSTPHSSDIQWLGSSGISTGWPLGNRQAEYRGMDSVKRQDMAAFLYRLAGSPEYYPTSADKGVFIDVNEATPHAMEIWWLSSMGISEGWELPDGSREFRGMEPVRRQDMAAFLYRIASSPQYSPTDSDKNSFLDVNPSTPHCNEIWWMASNGISTGWMEPTGGFTFRGMDTVKRQDMAAFLRRLSSFDLVADNKQQ
ncbi:BspA family leucine-rich repeat surface protein [Candidatus Collinsella stercoripullorum]|uniref:BspA family leucine-rich repeat surface protein n=1 Tax=Candidatus Collinsella stercoripullorum TaxID=2838522 RepID=UPI0022E8DF2A|nr:BspA family leucine-rich repeat surface protein [Candidatus Collinsella stercoripullorum]